MTANELRQWRRRHGLSQTEAAALIQCSRRGLQLWEGGHNRIPGTVTLAVAEVTRRLKTTKPASLNRFRAQI
jgi:DNA-binding XRE family transcriptional regulator